MWLLYGPERYALHTYLMQLLKLPGESMREMNTTRLDAPNAEQIRTAADALPFFDDLRVVVCEKTDPDTVAAIAEKPERIPETTVLAFVHYGKLRADSAMLKPFKKAGRDVLIDVRSEAQAKRFLDDRVRRSGALFKYEAIETLLERRGTDLAQLESDIGVLSCIHGDGAPVTAEDVKRYVPEKTENKSWDLLARFLNGDMGGGLRMYRQMLMDDPKCEFMILGYVEKRVAQMIEVQSMLRMRMSEKEIGDETGVKGYSLTSLIRDAKKADPAMLRRALEELTMADYRIKSGRRGSQDALFMAFAEGFSRDGKKEKR